MRPFPILPFLDGIAAAVAAAEAAFANAVARQPPPPPPTRTAIPFATPVNTTFVAPVILPPPPEIDTQDTPPIQLVSYKQETGPQLPDGEQIRKDVIAGKSIDQIANDQHTTREQVIATMKAAGMTVETADPTGKGDARTTAITDPKSGQVVTEHTDFNSGNYYITVKGPDGKETSSPLRDGRGWKVTTSQDEKTGAITTRYEDDLGSGMITEETRFQDGTVVQKSTPKDGTTTTVVTLPGGKKVTLDAKQNPSKDAAGIRADVLGGKSIDQIALDRGLTTDQVTAGLAAAGLQLKTETSTDGYVQTTRILDRNGKEIAGYTNDYGKGEHTSREIDAKGNSITTTKADAGTEKKTVVEPNGRKTETTTEKTKEGSSTTIVVTFNGYTLTTKPNGSMTLTDNATGNKLNLKAGSVEAALAKTLMEVDPNSSDPATAKKAQVAKTVIEGMLAGEAIPGLQQDATDRHTDTQNALKQYGPGQVGANATPQNPYGDRPFGKAPSGGDWVPMNGVWMDPKLAQAIAAENTALSKLSEAQAKARQGQAQYEVYALDPAYKDALGGAKSIIDRALEPFNLVWNPSKPEGTLAEAQQRLTDAKKQSTEASQARGEYETAQKLLSDAITKQAQLPPLINPKQPSVHAVGTPSNPELDAANAKAAHADVDAMFYGVRLHTANGDKFLSDYMVDLRQSELNATKPGTPENKQAQQALTDAKDLQSKAGDQQTAAQAYYDYYSARANLTQLQSQATGIEQQLYSRWAQKNSWLFEKDKEFNTNGGDYLGKLKDIEVYVDPNDHQVHVKVQFEHGTNDHQLTGSEKDIGKDAAKDPLNQQWQALVSGANKNKCGLDGLAAADATAKSTAANLNKTLAGQLTVDIKDLDTKIGQLKSDLDAAIAKHGNGTIEAPSGLLPPGVKPVKVTVDGVDVWVSPDDADDVQKNGLDALGKRGRPVQVELNGELRWVDAEVAAAQVALKSTQDQHAALESERDALIRAQHWNEFQLTQPMALLDDAGAAENDARLQATYLDQHRDEALAGYQAQFGRLYDQGYTNDFHKLGGSQLDQAVAKGLNLNPATEDGRSSLKNVIDGIHDVGGDKADVKIVPVFYVDGSVGSQQTGLIAVKTGDGTKYVDVTGHHFDSLEDFQNNNRQFSESGKLVVPVGLEMNKVDGKIALNVVEARHVSTWDKVVDPLIGIGTGIATVASFTPAAPVAAWFAVAGGTYLGAKTGYNEYQYIKHGGDWTDGESLGNLFGVATAVLPVGSGSLRLITLAKSEIPLVAASRIAFGAVRSSTPYLQEAQGAMQASVFGGTGTKLMRTARGMDGTAIMVGVPQIGMSLNQLSQFDQMSGLDQANAVMGLGIGIYGTGMGYLHLRTSRPTPRAETECEAGTPTGDLPPADGAAPRGVIRLVDEHGAPFDAQVLGTRPENAGKVYVPAKGETQPQTLEDGTPLWAVDEDLQGKTHIVAHDPETGEAFVLPWIRGAADPGQSGPARGSGPQPLPVDQLRSMSKDDVGALSLADIILFTEDHTATLSNKQWSAFEGRQIAAIPEDAIPGIPPGRLARLRPEQTAAFTDGQLAAMTDAQARKLTLDQFGAFSPAQVGTIMDHHVTVLRPAQIGRLSTEQMAAVTPHHLSQFSENQILGLTSAQLAHLTTEQMATFTPDRIIWLQPEQLAALTPEQVRNLTTQQIAALKPAQVMHLTEDQLAVLSLDQVRALTRTQISALRPSQVAALSPEQLAAIPADRMTAFSSGQLAALSDEQLTALSGDQVAVLSDQQKAKLTTEQRAALEGPGLGKPIGEMSNNEIAAIPLAAVHKLHPNELAACSVPQLHAFTGEQVAVMTDGQTASLSAEQRAALDAPRAKGVKKALSGLIAEVRQNGLSYLAMGASSAVFGYTTMKFGVLPWFNSSGYLLRGTGFIMQAKWPEKFGAGTKWAPRFAKMYAGTFLPNVYSGTMAMFDPAQTPGVYIPFGIGTLPFAAQQAHYAIKGEPARAPLGNHLGYAGYTLGSGWYVYDTIWGAEVGSDLGPIVPASSAVMFQLGSELWIGAWVASRQANRDTPRPGTSRTRLDDIVDSIVLDRIAPKMEGKVPQMVDRIAFGLMYGGGLVLFGAMGFATLFKKLLADNAKPAPVPTPSSTPSSTPTATPTPTQPPQTPPMLPPEQPPETQPHFVIVGRWRTDGGVGDNSTLWDIAGNNLGTLMTPQQKSLAAQNGLSVGDDRDTLIADYGLPAVIDLNPQYPLAQRPNLIQPGWRLNVG